MKNKILALIATSMNTLKKQNPVHLIAYGIGYFWLSRMWPSFGSWVSDVVVLVIIILAIKDRDETTSERA